MTKEQLTTRIFISYTFSDKRFAKAIRNEMVTLLGTSPRDLSSKLNELTADQIFLDLESFEPMSPGGLNHFSEAAESADVLAVLIPPNGVPAGSFVQKEMLAFLTGVVHSTRDEPIGELTSEQLDRARGRLAANKVVLIDPSNELRWLEGRFLGLGPNWDRGGALSSLMDKERPRLRFGHQEHRAIAVAVLAHYAGLPPETVFSELESEAAATRRRRSMLTALAIIAMAALTALSWSLFLKAKVATRDAERHAELWAQESKRADAQADIANRNNEIANNERHRADIGANLARQRADAAIEAERIAEKESARARASAASERQQRRVAQEAQAIAEARLEQSIAMERREREARLRETIERSPSEVATRRSRQSIPSLAWWQDAVSYANEPVTSSPPSERNPAERLELLRRLVQADPLGRARRDRVLLEDGSTQYRLVNGLIRADNASVPLGRLTRWTPRRVFVGGASEAHSIWRSSDAPNAAVVATRITATGHHAQHGTLVDGTAAYSSWNGQTWQSYDRDETYDGVVTPMGFTRLVRGDTDGCFDEVGFITGTIFRKICVTGIARSPIQPLAVSNDARHVVAHADGRLIYFLYPEVVEGHDIYSVDDVHSIEFDAPNPTPANFLTTDCAPQDERCAWAFGVVTVEGGAMLVSCQSDARCRTAFHASPSGTTSFRVAASGRAMALQMGGSRAVLTAALDEAYECDNIRSALTEFIVSDGGENVTFFGENGIDACGNMGWSMWNSDRRLRVLSGSNVIDVRERTFLSMSERRSSCSRDTSRPPGANFYPNGRCPSYDKFDDAVDGSILNDDAGSGTIVVWNDTKLYVVADGSATISAGDGRRWCDVEPGPEARFSALRRDGSHASVINYRLDTGGRTRPSVIPGETSPRFACGEACGFVRQSENEVWTLRYTSAGNALRVGPPGVSATLAMVPMGMAVGDVVRHGELYVVELVLGDSAGVRRDACNRVMGRSRGLFLLRLGRVATPVVDLVPLGSPCAVGSAHVQSDRTELVATCRRGERWRMDTSWNGLRDAVSAMDHPER